MLAVVFGICSLFLLSAVILLICLYARKSKQKESSRALNEQPETSGVIYEDPDSLITDKVQPKVVQNNDLPTTENVAYSTTLQIPQDKKEELLTTAENPAYSTTVEFYWDEEEDNEY